MLGIFLANVGTERRIRSIPRKIQMADRGGNRIRNLFGEVLENLI
jgi:hypothetical protein